MPKDLINNDLTQIKKMRRDSLNNGIILTTVRNTQPLLHHAQRTLSAVPPAFCIRVSLAPITSLHSSTRTKSQPQSTTRALECALTARGLNRSAQLVYPLVQCLADLLGEGLSLASLRLLLHHHQWCPVVVANLMSMYVLPLDKLMAIALVHVARLVTAP